MASMIVTQCARRATRITVSGARTLRALKRLAHRMERRATRVDLLCGREPFVRRYVTGWDVA